MRLIIGGAGQGKRDYALRRYGFGADSVATTFQEAMTCPIFDDYHLAVKAALNAGEDPAALTRQLLEANPTVLILCDEVGCGVVPVDRSERHWRETVGRLCCTLAQEAETVERVFCGLAMTLKAETHPEQQETRGIPSEGASK